MRILEIIISFIIGSVLGMAVMSELSKPFLDDQPINYQVVRFSEADAKVYLSSRSWGIGGGSEEVRVCGKPIDFQDQQSKEECLIFHTSEIYYKKDGPKKLLIRTFEGYAASGNPHRLGDIDVVVTPFRNGEDSDEFIANYEKHGYEIITLPY
jgi:hypothetical protein